MMNSMIAKTGTIAVGDQVWIINPMFVQNNGIISAEVIETRRILGEQTFLIVTEMGERKLVGAHQISQVEPSTR